MKFDIYQEFTEYYNQFFAYQFFEYYFIPLHSPIFHLTLGLIVREIIISTFSQANLTQFHQIWLENDWDMVKENAYISKTRQEATTWGL